MFIKKAFTNTNIKKVTLTSSCKFFFAFVPFLLHIIRYILKVRFNILKHRNLKYTQNKGTKPFKSFREKFARVFYIKQCIRYCILFANDMMCMKSHLVRVS